MVYHYTVLRQSKRGILVNATILAGNTLGSSNGCHGCALVDSTVTSQWQIVSLKNIHTKSKQVHLPSLVKWYLFDIDGCGDGNYSSFLFCLFICWDMCMCKTMTFKVIVDLMATDSVQLSWSNADQCSSLMKRRWDQPKWVYPLGNQLGNTLWEKLYRTHNFCQSPFLYYIRNNIP